METNSLFPLKYRLRETDEPVEVVAWETSEKGTRSDSDWVSYIDALGLEHVKERLTLEWDFVIDSPFDKVLAGGFGSSLPAFDPWEARRYELVKEYVMRDLANDKVNVDKAVAFADDIISALKKSHEAEEEPKKGL